VTNTIVVGEVAFTDTKGGLLLPKNSNSPKNSFSVLVNKLCCFLCCGTPKSTKNWQFPL